MYVAFLRGINVGGRKAIKMADLRAAFEAMGLRSVRTIQTSGNVVFDAGTDEDLRTLATQIEVGLSTAFGSRIAVHIRTLAGLRALVASDPFRDVPRSPDTRLYVTFLPSSEKGTDKRLEREPALPSVPGSAGDAFRLVKRSGAEVLTAITLTPRWGTTELMAWLEKQYGSGVTTRNWNTITSIVEAAAAE